MCVKLLTYIWNFWNFFALNWVVSVDLFPISFMPFRTMEYISLMGKNKWPLPLFDECKQWKLCLQSWSVHLFFPWLKKSWFLKAMLLLKFSICWCLNILKLFHILMMLNKCIFQWFQFDCSTKGHIFMHYSNYHIKAFA